VHKFPAVVRHFNDEDGEKRGRNQLVRRFNEMVTNVEKKEKMISWKNIENFFCIIVKLKETEKHKGTEQKRKKNKRRNVNGER
jgi:hypothetical protein